MTKKQDLPSRLAPPADSKNQNAPKKADQSEEVKGRRRPSPTSEMAYELIALDGPEYHVQHWGINE